MTQDSRCAAGSHVSLRTGNTTPAIIFVLCSLVTVDVYRMVNSELIDSSDHLSAATAVDKDTAVEESEEAHDGHAVQ